MPKETQTIESPRGEKDRGTDFVEDFMRNIEMYNLPGYPSITKDDVLRYYTNNEILKKLFTDFIKQSLKDDDRFVRERAIKIIQYAPENERAELRNHIVSIIKQALKDKDRYVRGRATIMIQYAPENERADFIKQALKDKDRYVSGLAIEMIQYTPENERAELRNHIVSIIKQALENKNPVVRGRAIEMIQYTPENERADFIKQALKDNDWYVCVRAIEIIQYAPENEQAELRNQIVPIIKQALKNKRPGVRGRAIEMIQYTPENERAELRNQIVSIIKQALKDNNWFVRARAAEMIQYAPENEQSELRNQLVPIIKQALEDKNSVVREIATIMIQYTPENERADFIKQALKDEDRLQEVATQTPLYKSAGDKRFVREVFDKTGSGITLLDKVPGREQSLKEKVIVRHIKLVPYLEWKKAFEAHEFWSQKGFDYVPIEPIVKIRKPKPTLEVDVFSRVIAGPSVSIWRREVGVLFFQEIQEQVDKITEGLKELGIEHGHLHDNNFVLYFSRKENGKPDLSRPPRVYAIDFDAAYSPG